MVKKEVGERDWKDLAEGQSTKNVMAISDSTGLPTSVYVASTASPHHEVILDEATISKCFITDEKPRHLVVGDKAYDR
jgi:hypothetical protein